ncbi:hypothetical protein FS837_008240, partial [Tulasnella sp. UAMH 9824]
MAPQNQVAIPVDDPFPQTHAFIQLVGVRAEQDVAFNSLSVALHQLNAKIMMNEAAEIGEEILLVVADDAVLAAYNAFQMELLAFMGDFHLINNPPPPQHNHNTTYAIAAGGALLAVGAVAVAPALALVVLNVVGFSPAGPVAGSLAAAAQSAFYGGAVTSGSLFALCQSAAMGGIAVGAAQVAAGITAVGA